MNKKMENKYTVLKQVFGYDTFREGQEALIDALLAGRDVLGVMPTGAGKSICYQVPAILMPGITLVISPLISLMKDQVMALKQAGIAGAYINSSLSPQACQTVIARAAANWYQIIYIAPERLDTPSFLHFARQANISVLIIDEAHCISQWGHDFRPSYRKIIDFVQPLPRRPVIGAFTATATERVRQDIIASLGLVNPFSLTASFDRPNLYFAVWQPKDKSQALMGCLADKRDKSGIVYCATRKTVEQVCDELCQAGYLATRYHAGLSDDERRRNQEDFQYDRKTLMVATNAFGMGIDKSNVAFVVHYNMPKSMESYYQEAGRAGRDGAPADCILFFSKQDVRTAKWQITHGNDNPALTVQEQKALLTCNMNKLNTMIAYATGKACLRNTILRYFGESRKDGCGHCGYCCADTMASICASDSGMPTNTVTMYKMRVNKQLAVHTEAYGALLRSLKMLRSRIAAEEHVPAYMVFTDATLAAMAQYQPRTLDAFSDIIGVGTTKRAKYGERFIDCIRNTVGEPAPSSSSRNKPQTKQIHLSNYRARLAEKGITEAYQPWTEKEEAELRNEFRVGLSIGQLAEQHGRTKGAIRARLKKIGLMD